MSHIDFVYCTHMHMWYNHAIYFVIFFFFLFRYSLCVVALFSTHFILKINEKKSSFFLRCFKLQRHTHNTKKNRKKWTTATTITQKLKQQHTQNEGEQNKSHMQIHWHNSRRHWQGPTAQSTRNRVRWSLSARVVVMNHTHYTAILFTQNKVGKWGRERENKTYAFAVLVLVRFCCLSCCCWWV